MITSSAIRVMQIKTTMKYFFAPTGMSIIIINMTGSKC